MRDGQIISMQQVNARRDALILRQWEFLETRQRAFESVVRNAGFWAKVRYFFNTPSFLNKVDSVQMALLQEAKRMADAAAQRVREQGQKPRLTIVGANGQVNGHV